LSGGLTETVPVIAVDGPAASGKGTIAAGMAAALGFHLLDSGALYRLVALAALDRGIQLTDAGALAEAALALDATFAQGLVLAAGRDVTTRLRDEDVSAAASRVAVFPGVRQALLARQRGFRQAPGLVADGRDMGTVVFPDAALKVYVTASLEERAARRHKQLIAKGISVTIDGLLRELRERDARDTGRAEAPLKPAADAVRIDTSGRLAADSIADALELWHARRR
jgi:CMP/dCMP kinase